MRKFFALIGVLMIAGVALAQGLGERKTNMTVVSFSATPIFDAGASSTFKITLTGNVTSSSVVGQDHGQTITFIICQDGIGARTFVWPLNMQGTSTIGANASTCTAQAFVFDGPTGYGYAVTAGSVSPSSGGFYGTKWGADSLGNNTTNNSDTDCRFRADDTSTLSSVKWYVLAPDVFHAGGYSGGNNGQARVQIRNDDGTSNHLAVSGNLASFDQPKTDACWTNGGGTPFCVSTFSSPPSLTAGTLYHIYFTNIDSAPTTNWFSTDNLAQDQEAPVPSQPTVSDLDWAEYFITPILGSSWTQRKGHSCILDLTYGDGHHQGNGYMETWNPSQTKNITGATWARENFTVSGGDKVVTAVSFRMNKSSGTDPLTVTLQTGAGSTIETGTIPNAAFVTGANYGWVTYTFTATRTLTNASTYNIIVNSPSSSTFTIYPIRQGSAYGFNSALYYNDGLAQYSTDSGSTWNNWHNLSDVASTEGDLQFYFTLK